MARSPEILTGLIACFAGIVAPYDPAGLGNNRSAGNNRPVAVNEQLGLQLSDPDYDTIAGYMLGKLGRIPRDSDVVEGDGVRLRVEEMDGMRIARLSLENLKPPAGDDDPVSGEAGSPHTHNGV